MTEPLPCPFCGHVGLSQREGSSFRWLSTECNGCGAQCGEERIDTLSTDHSAAIEQAKEAAIKTWNTRAAQPKQQAEPVEERITHITWDERGVRTVNGIPDDSPQRQWVGLTDEDYKGISSGDQVVAMWAERILKERNT